MTVVFVQDDNRNLWLTDARDIIVRKVSIDEEADEL
jgi:hypothetical protein